ncbi:MAG: NADH:ubiquinone reductase (Na(+)-transporting) subunit A, partial [Muribaculaceae bacterium]|nr:NADH:ubiquinone reductase (Na(+)-transporting) subunit A [Muribaculaceae bacterium]
TKSVKFDVTAPVRELLQQSGLWVMMRQRPYDIVPAAASEPRDIFVTAFDSSPLAPSLLYAVKGKDAALAAGVKALASLTQGKVYISVPEGASVSVPGAEIVTVKGPHPSGNPGVQIANIAPVNKGEIVWTLDVVTLAKIGTLMLTGSVEPDVTIAITGSEVTAPCYAVTVPGCDIKQLLNGRTDSSDTHLRIISGNVLTGIKTDMDGFLQYPYRQITVIPEGDNADEFLGWANPGAGKMSVKRSILGHFLKGRRFAPDARINGGRRAMILSGEYDSVLPMDILGEYLIKAIMARDIDRMEQLGIYEVAPEDFALPEYVDTSKLELQKIVREGLDYMRRETE